MLGGNVETVSNENEIHSLKNNKIVGEPNIQNSNIIFHGTDNVLYCENKVNIVGSTITFKGNNALIYLSSTNSNYTMYTQTSHNSLLYIGKENNIVPRININAQEHKNVIIGDDGTISSNVSIRTTDAHSFYNVNTKKRINQSGSVYIGDHVFLGHNAYIEKGVKIGSGSIIENNAHVNSNAVLQSNCYYSGDPVRLLEKDVFFTKDYPANYDEEDTLNSEDYKSNVFIFDNTSGDSLDANKIDAILSNFSVSEKIDFIHKLFVQNKKQNRFSI